VRASMPFGAILKISDIGRPPVREKRRTRHAHQLSLECCRLIAAPARGEIMSLDRWGAGALILGSIVYIALMAVHPSHVGPPVIGHLSLSALVHGAATVINPLLAFGFLTITLRLGTNRPLPLLAFSFYLFSALIVLMASTMSGFVIPEIVHAGQNPPRGPDGAVIDPEGLRVQLQSLANYTVWLNRSFAQVNVALFSIAIVLWSIAWPSRALTDWVVRILGFILGIGVLAWQLSGTLTLEAQHGALVVTLAHSLWTMIAASLLLRPREA
jgi:hypothetical protein